MAQVDRVKAAEIMFGTGSKQHKAAIKRFGKGGGPKAQVVTPKSGKGTKAAGKGSKGKGGGGRGQRRDSKGRFA